MKLRDMLSAVRGYQEAQGDLEAAKINIARLEREKTALEDRCEKLVDADSKQQVEIRYLHTKVNALTSALNVFSPHPDSVNDLKRFYDIVSTDLDREGFTLFAAAQKITGINVCSSYPYEDNRGCFETADGHTMLGYLIASHFNAVEWHVVPGTSYESAELLDVNKTTPEYMAFEKRLYTEALRKLGFELTLPSEHNADKKIERGRPHER